MLHDLTWLQPGEVFPPLRERPRIDRYMQNKALFDNRQFSDGIFRYMDGATDTVSLYDRCAERISQVVGNFEDVISIPVLLNYQRFMSLKMADLVAGEFPIITGATSEESTKLKWVADNTNLFEKLYSMVIDLSRYGDCVLRMYKDAATGYYTFTVWDAPQWYPIVSNDGTYSVTQHCLVWLENRAVDKDVPDFYLNAQVFDVSHPGSYTQKVFHNGSNLNVVGDLISTEEVPTGLSTCAVLNLRQYAVSGTVFGYDDYLPLDSLITEIIERVSQISVILDKHADPSMTGPISMLSVDPKTGERSLQHSKFYVVTDTDKPPQYLVWNGQLEAAFKQLDFLLNQLYILSEMGAAITGGVDSSGNVVSGNAMRFKMVNPLAKARRVSNSLTKPLRNILSVIGSSIPDIDVETASPGKGVATTLPYGHISISWKDGLPDDPRERIEMCKLASGEQKMLPMEDCLVEYMDKTPEEAKSITKTLRDRAAELLSATQSDTNDHDNSNDEESNTDPNNDPNKPGPQDGTGVNPSKKGSKTGIKNFQSENNKTQKDK